MMFLRRAGWANSLAGPVCFWDACAPSGFLHPKMLYDVDFFFRLWVNGLVIGKEVIHLFIHRSAFCLEDFNACPGPAGEEQIRDVFDVNASLEFCDVDDLAYWKNDSATAVFAVRGNPFDFPVAESFRRVSAFRDLYADEFDWKVDRSTGLVVVRLWWD